MGKPILVTGSHRSGTTWVGRMLALSPSPVYINEPTRMSRPTKLARANGLLFDRWYPYIARENEGAYRTAFERVVRMRYPLSAALRARPVSSGLLDYGLFLRCRVQGRRALLKAPQALFSAEWIADRFAADVVILVRHPAAFAGSLKRKGWTFPFADLLEQPLLLEHHLGEFEPEIRAYTDRCRDVVDQAALLWKLIYSAVARFRERHPSWNIVRHEDLSRDVVGQYERLYEALGLRFSPEVRERIWEHSRPANPSEVKGEAELLKRDSRSNIFNWKHRLSPDEIERVRTIASPVWREFYTERDW